MLYEYRELGRHHIKTEELNELGKEGWEMITALRMSGGYQMIFKRAVEAVKRPGRPPGSKNKVKT